MLVLVYGTLRRGFGNHRRIADGGGVFLGEHRVDGWDLWTLHGGFPAASRGEEDSWLVGEVYDVDEATFASLDALEGFPHHYDRCLVPTPWGDAWMYFYPNRDRFGRFRGELIHDWAEFKAQYLGGF